MGKNLNWGDKSLIIICNLGLACLVYGVFFLGLLSYVGQGLLPKIVGFFLTGVFFVAYSVARWTDEAQARAREQR